MNKIYKLLIMSFLMFTVTSCGDDLLDINTDPDAATTVSADQLFPGILANIASNRSIEIGVGMSEQVQHWASNGSAGVFLNPERYTISPFTTGNTWSFMYINALSNLTLAIKDAEGSDPVKNNVAAQCKVLSAMVYFQLSLIWEKVPFTEANNTEIPVPSFDEQETIFRGTVALLDEAIAQMDPASELTGVTDGDFIYGGDINMWRKFAKSLKLRIYMYLYNKDTSVGTQIAALIAENDLITTVSDEASIPFYNDVNNANNLWKLYNQFGGFEEDGSITNASAYLYAAAPIVDLMNGKSDPRRNTFFGEGTDAAPGEFIGNEPGSTGGDDDIAVVSTNIIRMDFPDRLVTASEILLYIAEYHAISDDLSSADNAYRAAIAASMDFWDGTDGEISEGEETAYITSLPALSTLSKEAALTAIREEQYVDLYGRGPDAWANWKRTHVPVLDLPSNATLGGIIRRYPYPPDEKAANPKVPTDPALDKPMWYEN